MPIDWKSIRPYEGSQHSAFEELVCQIAYNKFDSNNNYTRVKAPDGGVESYLILANGDEIGWQAKYFFDIQESQFNQIEKSFKTAIKKHPRLKKYYVCCPIDKQDPRIEERKYLQDRWNDFVENCKTIAKDEGLSLEIEYWGAFELNHELQKSYSAGMTAFWFGGDDFSDAWFEEQTNISIKNLGARYSTELNFEYHDIANYFDTVVRNKRFKDDIFSSFQSLFKSLNTLNNSLQRTELDKKHNIFINLQDIILKLKDDWRCIYSNGITKIDFKHTKNQINTVKDSIENLLETEQIKDKSNAIDNDCWKLKGLLDDFIDKNYHLANEPYLIIHGDAGIGKSHLLGDLANNLILENKKCVFILGQRLTNSTNPWTQILKDELRLNCNEYEFLGVLNTIGQAQQERVLVIIDALNEGEGRKFWKDSLAGFIESFKKYPWVGLILSIRSEYKDDILTNVQNDIDNDVVGLIQHRGFDINVIDAVEYFFNHFQIPLPSEPLLVDEFRNPLFLKIYCAYRQGKPIEKVSTLISEVFKQYFLQINERVSEHLGYRKGRNVVPKALDNIAESIFLSNNYRINYDDALNIIDRNYSNIDSDKFLQELIAENLLTAQTDYQTDSEYLHFAFERFFDYLTAKYLCDNLKTKEDFKNKLHYKYGLLEYKDKTLYQGTMNILAFLIPIKYEFEIYEIVDLESIDYPLYIIDSFIDGLYWRDDSNLDIDKIRNFINQHIFIDDYLFTKFINLHYQVAGKENHPLNADKLHSWLASKTLAERDSFWTTKLADYNYDVFVSLRAMTGWAKNRGFSKSLSDKSRFLIASALSWALATTCISVRDNTTIALARLLQNNLSVAKDVLIRFSQINDPYIVERVFSAIYGAVLTSQELAGLTDICDYLLTNFFTADEVYPNVLVRDYAKHIVEFANIQTSKKLTDQELELIRPPYNSLLPSSFPTNDEIDNKYNTYEGKEKPRHYYSIDAIFDSMTTEYGRGICGYGDFGRYTFQSNFYNWKDQVNIDLLSNYAIKLIFEKYGYDAELHGEFDRNSRGDNRHENRIERIGKKYQWIAMYEVMARVADNIKMIDPSTRYHDKKEVWYNGTFEPCLRDIDPSLIHANNDKRIIETPKYDDWGDDFEEWVVSKDNLIDVKELISIEFNQKQWLSLQRYVDYRPQYRLDEDDIDRNYQDFWYRIQACLVHNDEFETFKNNIQNKSFMNNWMPQPVESHNEICYGEYYWLPLLSFFENEYYGERGWQKVEYYDPKTEVQNKDSVTPHNVDILDIIENKEGDISEVLTTLQNLSNDNVNEEKINNYQSKYKTLGMAYSCCDEYVNEGVRNRSLGCSIYIPSKVVFDALKLKNDTCAGSWLNQNNDMVMFDASEYGNDKSNLVITLDELIKLEQKTDCRVIWAVLAEKVAMYGYGKSTKKRLGISGVYYLENGEIKGDDYFYVN